VVSDTPPEAAAEPAHVCFTTYQDEVERSSQPIDHGMEIRRASAPRERPIPWLGSASPFYAAGTAMSTNDGAVDHVQTVSGFLGEPVKDAFPDAAL
jgi:hypothetical protein